MAVNEGRDDGERKRDSRGQSLHNGLQPCQSGGMSPAPQCMRLQLPPPGIGSSSTLSWLPFHQFAPRDYE